MQLTNLFKKNRFLTNSSDKNDTTPASNQTSQKLNESDQSTTTSKTKKTEPNEVHYSNVKLRVVPKYTTTRVNSSKIDYSKRYTANNFITTVRAFNEFLLKPG